jgi:glutamate racemase
MKLGIFDSGLGGLLITKAIQERMPDIDLVYYGDTLHLAVW